MDVTILPEEEYHYGQNNSLQDPTFNSSTIDYSSANKHTSLKVQFLPTSETSFSWHSFFAETKSAILFDESKSPLYLFCFI